MNRRFLGTSLVSLVVALGLFGGVASAHVLKVDGTIGAVLHIQPDDNPTTGDSTTYILAFSDESNKFTLPKCICKVDIEEGGKTIYSHALTITNSLNSVDTYTFQKPDVYTMHISGTPKESGAFQSFGLDYLVRVEPGQGSIPTQSFPPMLWIGMSLAIGLVLLGGYASNISSSGDETKV